MISFLRKPKELNEGKLAEERARGDHAEALLRDDVLMAAFADVEGVYLEAWRKSGFDEVDLRERAHIAVGLLNDLKSRLISFVQDGAVAREKLKRDVARRA
jgi:hypothetical protein